MNNRKLNRTRPVKLLMYGEADRLVPNEYWVAMGYWHDDINEFGTKFFKNGVQKARTWSYEDLEVLSVPADNLPVNRFDLFMDQQIIDGLELWGMPIKYMDFSQFSLNYFMYYGWGTKLPNEQFPATLAGLTPKSFRNLKELELWGADEWVERRPVIYPFIGPDGHLKIDLSETNGAEMTAFGIYQWWADKLEVKTKDGIIPELSIGTYPYHRVADNNVKPVPETLDLSKVGVTIKPGGRCYIESPHAELILPPKEAFGDTPGMIRIFPQSKHSYLQPGVKAIDLFGPMNNGSLVLGSARNLAGYDELELPQKLVDISGLKATSLSITDDVAGVISDGSTAEYLVSFGVTNSPLSPSVIDPLKKWTLDDFKAFMLAHPKIKTLTLSNNSLDDQEMYDFLVWIKDILVPTRVPAVTSAAKMFCYFSYRNIALADHVDLSKRIRMNQGIGDSALNTLATAVRNAGVDLRYYARECNWQITALDENTLQLDWTGVRNPNLYSGTTKVRFQGYGADFPGIISSNYYSPISGSRTADYRQFKVAYPAHGKPIGSVWRQVVTY